MHGVDFVRVPVRWSLAPLSLRSAQVYCLAQRGASGHKGKGFNAPVPAAAEQGPGRVMEDF